jgi:DUF4097 and DUF4098 domain-containing protein YvlB
MRNFLIILASVTLGSFLIAAALFYVTGGIRPVRVMSSEISESAQFETGNIGKIDISTVSTNVSIMPSDDEKIHVDFTGQTSAGAGTASPRMETKIEGDVLRVQIMYPSGVIFSPFNLSTLNLDVYIPQGYEKDLHVSTTSGAIVLEEISLGNMKANSVSGKIDIESILSKKISIDNTSGRVTLVDSKGDLNINTISGKVSAELLSLEDELMVNSVSGAVEVFIPQDSGFSFKLSSISGKLENDFQAKITKSNNRNMEGTVGDGKGMISIHTVSGKIILKYHQ